MDETGECRCRRPARQNEPSSQGCITEDPMPDKWLTIAAAAATLNVHPRTIERRIASGKIQTSRTDDGQVQVLVNMPDEPAAVSDPLETVRELAQDQVSLATGSASAIVRLAQADADRARGELELVRQEAVNARRGSRVAWSAVAVMAIAVGGAVGWTTHRVTRADDELATLRETATRTEAEAQKLLADRDAARKEASTARLAGAEATGKLAAYVEQAQLQANSPGKRPASQPTTVLQRIASVLAGE